MARKRLGAQIGRTLARAIPAVVGGYLGGPQGAMAGYKLGSLADPLMPVDEFETKKITQPMAITGLEGSTPGLDESTSTIQRIQQDPSLFTKGMAVSDMVNTLGMSSGIGAGKGGVLNQKDIDVNKIAGLTTNVTDQIANADLTAGFNKVIPPLKSFEKKIPGAFGQEMDYGLIEGFPYKSNIKQYPFGKNNYPFKSYNLGIY